MTLMDSQLRLTEEIAEEAGMTVNREGFEAAMKEQQNACISCQGWLNGYANETLQTSL